MMKILVDVSFPRESRRKRHDERIDPTQTITNNKDKIFTKKIYSNWITSNVKYCTD